MPKYNFNLRNASAEGPTPINLVIRWGNRRLVYPTGEKIPPCYWCDKPGQRNFQRAKETKSFPEHPEFNNRLIDLLLKASTAFRNFKTDEGRDPEPDELRLAMDKATGKVEQQETDLLRFIAKYNKDREGAVNKKDGRALHPTYHGRNRLTLELLRGYAAKSRRGGRIPFAKVDKAFVDGFAKYLTTTKKLATNTVGKYMRALREFIGAAVDAGHEVSPAVVKRGGIGIPEDTNITKIALSPHELAAMLALDLSDAPRLDRTRDLFIVGAWTGLRFGDLVRIRPEHIDGDYIHIHTGKTGEEVTIPLHSHVRYVLAKYGGKMPPAKSNQGQNKDIKKVAAMVPQLQKRIMVGRTVGGQRQEEAKAKWELVATHTARRSFATNYYLDGMPIRTIRAITGHRTDAVFLRYVVLDGKAHADVLGKSKLNDMPVMKAV